VRLRARAHAEQHLRSRGRLAALYQGEWLENTMVFAGRCSFSLGELKYEYPQEIVPRGRDAGVAT
jgi:error-prone DNA polymerase